MKADPATTSDQKIKRELTAYIGFLVLILLVVKSAFYIFGMLGSNDQEDPVYFYGFWISLVLLIGIAIRFGWKRFGDPS